VSPRTRPKTKGKAALVPDLSLQSWKYAARAAPNVRVTGSRTPGGKMVTVRLPAAALGSTNKKAAVTLPAASSPSVGTS